MATTPLTPENSAVVLIDHEVGFSNLVRSHTIEETVNNTVALAKIAKVFDLTLVVTAARESDPAGPLYPELKDVLGDHPRHPPCSGVRCVRQRGVRRGGRGDRTQEAHHGRHPDRR